MASSGILQDLTKTPEQIARSVLAKAQNRINGSMTLGAIYVTHLIMGNGDSYCSFNTQVVNYVAYVQHFFPERANRLFPSYASKLYHRPVQDPDDESIYVFYNELDTYNLRSSSLQILSPLEYVMAVRLDKHPKTKPLPLMLDPAHPLARTHGLRPRTESTYVIPQFLHNAPRRPRPDAPSEEREDYAAYALTVFFSHACIPELQGLNLWDKLRAWEQGADTQRSKRIPNLDQFALRMLNNVETQAAARDEIKRDKATLRASRAAAKAAAAAEQVCEQSSSSPFTHCQYTFLHNMCFAYTEIGVFTPA